MNFLLEKINLIYVGLFYCCIINLPVLLAQDILIKGQILDAHLEEPIPFANIYVPNQPDRGTSSDFDGNYELVLKEIPDSLFASALGYDIKKIAYQNQTVLNFKLAATAYGLETVVIRPTEDPAVALFQKILAHKAQNNPKSLDYYQCEIYNKLELDLVNVSEGFQNMAINRPFKFAFTKIDSTSEELPFLPAFLIETLSDYTYIRQPKTEKDIVKASKVSGIKNASISQLLDLMYQNINIYDNWIPILTKEFVSPISDAGFSYYNYYLVDSAMIHNKWCYQIQYFSKSKSTNTFKGDFWVNDSTYAIKRINLQLFENADLNFVEKMSIVQNFQHWQDSIWIPEQEATVVSFDNISKPLLLDIFSKKIKENAPNIQGKRTTSYQQYNLSRPILTKEDSLINRKKIPTEQLLKDDDYWQEHRHIDLTKSEMQAEHLIDTIQELSVFNTWRTVTTLLFSGYVPWKIFDIGNVYSFYNKTSIEGKRFKVGLRTNSRMSKKFLVATYGAYGTLDKRFKFGLNTLFVFNKEPRQTLSATVIHDITQKHQFNIDFSLSSEGVLASNFIRKGSIPLKLFDIRHYHLAYFKENTAGLSLRASLEHQYTSPYFNFEYRLEDNQVIKDFRYTALGLKLRFAYQEKFLMGVFNRASLNSRFPIVSLNYKMGLKDVLNGQFSFHSLDLEAYDRWDIPPLGYLKTNVNMGKVFGTLPYLLLYVPQGNEGLFSNYNGFNLIPEYAFAADLYARISVDYHLDGLILKRLPLLKKLDWRAVTNFRLLWGDMSEKNRQANAANFWEKTNEDDAVRLLVPNERPYMEISAGIENILQVLRLDVIWKLNYREANTLPWGIRANLHIKF